MNEYKLMISYNKITDQNMTEYTCTSTLIKDTPPPYKTSRMRYGCIILLLNCKNVVRTFVHFKQFYVYFAVCNDIFVSFCYLQNCNRSYFFTHQRNSIFKYIYFYMFCWPENKKILKIGLIYKLFTSECCIYQPTILCPNMKSTLYEYLQHR